MDNPVFIATSDQQLTRAENLSETEWQVEALLTGISVTCLVVHPIDRNIVYVGTRENGMMRSVDRGQTWQAIGLTDQVVKSIAICRANPDVIYVGTKPPGIFVSRDGGQNWQESEAFRKLRRWFWFTPAETGDPYVMGLAVSPTNPDVVIAGIEFGGMFRSTDGGETWQGHLKSTSRDCHNLRFHATDGNWVYQAGGGWPAAASQDGGATWRQPKRGLRWSLYAMACAADPQDPSIWYLSATPPIVLPDLQKMPRGHWDGSANAFIFRKKGAAKWERLGGGLPQPLSHMAYSLLTDIYAPGHVYAGLSNGDVWHSVDYGDSWTQLPFNLTRIQYSLIKL